MKVKSIIFVGVATVVAMALQSCVSSTEMLTQRLTYRVTNMDGDGRTNQHQFNVQYDKFTIQYTADGGCTVMNNSDSMMYVDMGESYFMYQGEAYQLYDNTVRTNSSTTAVGVSGTQYYNNASGTVAVAGSNTNVAQKQEERVVTIPPFSRRQLKFYNLGSTSIKEIVNGKEEFKKVGSVYNYTDEYVDANGHVMTYSFNPQAYKKMARNNFTLTKEEILSKPSSVQKNSVGQRTTEGRTKKVLNKGLFFTFVGLGATLVLGIIMGTKNGDL